MKRLSPLAWFLPIGLLCVVACKKSQPLPPGDWLGRCAASTPADTATSFGPPPTTYVRDQAGMMRKAFAAQLDAGLSAFQKETCHQVMVVSVKSLDGKSLERFSQDYANRVGLGYRRLNNGVLLLLFLKEHKARIQIGCGLEDVISDAQANEILQRYLLPAAENGFWEKGILASVTALTALARNKPIPESFRPEGCRKNPSE